MPYNEEGYIQQAIAQQAKRVSEASSPMPEYKSHKKVWALKICEVASNATQEQESDGGAILCVEAGYAPIHVDREYVAKHKPEAGGYYVVYADGYKSFSPAKAFEEGYTRV